VVPGAAPAQREGHAEHPLSVPDGREHVVDEVGGALGRTATSAAGAEASTLAAERDEAIGAALGATKAREAVGEKAAAKEGLQLALDEAWDGRGLFVPSAAVTHREEVREVLAHRTMQDGLLRLAAAVAARGARHDTVGVPTSVPSRSASSSQEARRRREQAPKAHPLASGPRARAAAAAASLAPADKRGDPRGS